MGYGAQVVFALILGGCVACITWTITQEEVFQELRDFLARYRLRHRESWWRRKLAYMPTCPFCLSHYVAALAIAMLQFKMLVQDWRGYVVSLFSVVLIANVYLTLYHMLRVGLRWMRAKADRAELPALGMRKPAHPRPPVRPSIDLARSASTHRRSAHRLPSDRRV